MLYIFAWSKLAHNTNSHFLRISVSQCHGWRLALEECALPRPKERGTVTEGLASIAETTFFDAANHNLYDEDRTA